MTDHEDTPNDAPNTWGGRRPRAGAPAGNFNGLKHGRHSPRLRAYIRAIAQDPTMQATWHEDHTLERQAKTSLVARDDRAWLYMSTTPGCPPDDPFCPPPGLTTIYRRDFDPAARRSATAMGLSVLAGVLIVGVVRQVPTVRKRPQKMGADQRC